MHNKEAHKLINYATQTNRYNSESCAAAHARKINQAKNYINGCTTKERRRIMEVARYYLKIRFGNNLPDKNKQSDHLAKMIWEAMALVVIYEKDKGKCINIQKTQ